MDPHAVLVLSIVGLVALGTLFVLTTARRKDEARALRADAASPSLQHARSQLVPSGVSAAGRNSGREVERAAALERRRARQVPETPRRAPLALPPDEEALGVTRRQVLNRGVLAAMALGITGFGASMLAMLWPTLSGGFGANIRVGRLDEILQEINNKKEAFYYAAGRFYLNPYPKKAVPAAREVTAYGAVLPGYEQGVVALYQKCVHLGCRVPWCKTSQWFECPCHGSQYNRVGEKKGGPAPRGLDRFIVSVEAGGMVVVDTSQIITGPPIGTNTTGQEAEGPHCVGVGGEG